ncbi:MAG: hydrogenase maturation nickel metallochaperone HypA [Candidatus Omnitrophica bacterium]|nr:hydrogenase maturation nickel metallochaperone HypA [Candidatus Omnitrophota bacterium]
MHEYYLAKSVLDSVLEKISLFKDCQKITFIKLKIGKLKMVTAELFRETFNRIAKGTLCEGACLDVEIVEGDSLIVENIEGDFKD